MLTVASKYKATRSKDISTQNKQYMVVALKVYPWLTLALYLSTSVVVCHQHYLRTL